MTPSQPSSYTIICLGESSQLTPLTFDPQSSTLEVNKAKQSPLPSCGQGPSWIAFDTVKDKCFVIDESEPGRLFVARYERADGDSVKAELAGEQDGYLTEGNGSVSACVQNGCLYVANYLSGSVSIMPLDSTSRLPVQGARPHTFTFDRSGSSRNSAALVASRQDQSYAHDAVASPDGAWVYICDLGLDLVHRIKAAPSASAYTSASYDAAHSFATADGSGPRHLAFFHDQSDGRQFAYLTNELDGTLLAFSHDPQTGALAPIDEPVYALPSHVELGGDRQAGPKHTLAEVAVTKDGRFVYVSDRGDAEEDHISIFARDQASGKVRFVDWVPSGGRIPRHFSLSSDDKFLATVNSQSGNVVVLARDQHTGHLSDTGARAEVKGAVYASFVDL